MQSVRQNSKQVDLEISKKVKQLLGKMTLDEKIAELTQDAPANDRLGIPFRKLVMVYTGYGSKLLSFLKRSLW